jgi:ParB-like nuclease domain
MPTTTAATRAAKTTTSKTPAATKPGAKTPAKRNRTAAATASPRPATRAAAPKPRTGSRRTAAKASGRHRRASQPVTPPDRLFDVTTLMAEPVREDVERVPLEQITLAENPRKQISPEGIDRLSGMLMRSGQLTPAIGRRVSDTEVIVYAGQRRYLAAKRSPELAGSDGYEGLRPVVVLRVKLLDHTPTKAEIRRIQAQENQHEDLSMRDRQEQFIDCWLDHEGMNEDDRIAAVCDELGHGATLARNLRRQMTLPEDIRIRVTDRPTGSELSITLANLLADMHEISPQLTTAVAARITSTDHHQQALASMGAFVHRTVVEDEELYAVRIDEGTAVLGAYEEIERAREHLTDDGRTALHCELDVKPDKLDEKLKALATTARSTGAKIDVTRALRERAIAGRYAWVFHRGADYADAVWVIAPEFLLAEIAEALKDTEAAVGKDDHVFSAATVSDEDVSAAKEQAAAERTEARERVAEGQNSNLGLGHDIARKTLDPTDHQLDALRRVVAHLFCEHFTSIIAYGAGWSDRARQQPVGDSERFEPRSVDAIIQAELERALQEPDPLRGILQIVARFAAAFVLDRNGVTATASLGSTRIASRLARALPDGPGDLRTAIWDLMRPFLSPRMAELNCDDFVLDDTLAPAADLAAHRAASSLDEIDLGEERAAA